MSSEWTIEEQADDEGLFHLLDDEGSLVRQWYFAEMTEEVVSELADERECQAVDLQEEANEAQEAADGMRAALEKFLAKGAT